MKNAVMVVEEESNKFIDGDMNNYINSKRPIVFINHYDYKEVDKLVEDATNGIEKKIYEYREFGEVDFKSKKVEENFMDLYALLETIYAEGMESNVFLLLKGVDEQLKNPRVLAKLNMIAEKSCYDKNYNFITIIVSKSEIVPKELENYISIVDIKSPEQEDIESYIKSYATENGVEYNKNDMGELTILLKGLSKLQIHQVLNMLVEKDKKISFNERNKQVVIKEKGQIIKKSGQLELINFKENIDDIGGLDVLKDWLKNKSEIFRKLDEAIKFGVDVPKGVLLMGMPGCGKSLSVKAAARLFNVPLLRLDIGRLLGKYVGESEHNMREALKMAESISPSILWIDEIEKAFAGIDQSGGASDITKRLFGHFLTWLQEKENTVFVVATANDISSFPPEFLRKGRFDEIFYLNFPNEKEREMIFKIHFKKRGKDNKNIDYKELAKNTEGFSGADIESVVKESVEELFFSKEKEISKESIENVVRNTNSISVVMSDKIKALKETLKKYKIKPASKDAEGSKPENEDMIYVQGGKLKLSYYAETELKVESFYMSKYQTTQDIYKELMGTNPSKFKGDRRPVEKVSWLNALEFCNRLSEKEGLKPVYKVEGIVLKKIVYRNGDEKNPNEADFTKTEGYRLPLEIEWEWAACGGQTAIQNGTYSTKYSGSDEINEVAWYKGNSNKMTHDVGGLKPNELGIYDMSGNLLEWCYDSANNTAYIPEDKPYIYDGANSNRRLKGGSWWAAIDTCGVATRIGDALSIMDYYDGFRVCRSN